MDDLQQEQEPRTEGAPEPEGLEKISLPPADDSIPSSIASFFPEEPVEKKTEPPEEKKSEEPKEQRQRPPQQGQGQKKRRGGQDRPGGREGQEQRRPQGEARNSGKEGQEPRREGQEPRREGQEPRREGQDQRRESQEQRRDAQDQRRESQEQRRDAQDQRRQQQRRENPQPRQPQAQGDAAGGVDISVVIPCFNENESLRELSNQLKSVLNRMTGKWEVWFIDDGSTDNSFKTLQDLNRNDRRFKTARFRRNFGKSAALSVGFQHARGEYVVTMDADLQDDPQEIPRLIEKINSGFDLVSGWKKKRRDPINKTIPSKFFNFVTGKISGIKIHDFNCGLKAYRKDVIKSVQLYGEMHRYIPVLAKMAGFTVSEIPVTHHPRKYGRTKFGMSRYFKGFLDLLTVMFTSRYNQRPLHLFGTIGLIFFLLGFAIEVYLSVEWWLGSPISNRPMLFLGILLILVGIQSISTGLLAEMITKSQLGTTHYPTRSILK